MMATMSTMTAVRAKLTIPVSSNDPRLMSARVAPLAHAHFRPSARRPAAL
jgi:hypothetical protein